MWDVKNAKKNSRHGLLAVMALVSSITLAGCLGPMPPMGPNEDSAFPGEEPGGTIQGLPNGAMEGVGDQKQDGTVNQTAPAAIDPIKEKEMLPGKDQVGKIANNVKDAALDVGGKVRDMTGNFAGEVGKKIQGAVGNLGSRVRESIPLLGSLF